MGQKEQICAQVPFEPYLRCVRRLSLGSRARATC